MTFHVGQRVVCVWGDFDHWGETLPVTGGVYTIRAIRSGEHPYDSSELYFHLVEIVNDPRLYQEGLAECAFWARCFRPVVERDTSAEVAKLKRLLVTAPAKVDA